MFPLGANSVLPNFLFGVLCVAITSLVRVLRSRLTHASWFCSRQAARAITIKHHKHT
ncbi:hypothetical protein RRG08_059329 [Elysia crispata]|uniref:Uncharacterized protein n=1 Tax=Elysia crispata TaxID=231223 RepID=A0AAE1EE77_9GAST|nr:hypothetical protein RRG08_059329 [Elysia crispata]